MPTIWRNHRKELNNIRPVVQVGGLLPPMYDEIQVEYPDPSVEVYRYFLTSELERTIMVTYTSSSKEFISSITTT